MFVCARGWSVTYSNGQRTIPGMSEREGWRGGRGTPPPLCEVAAVDGGSVVLYQLAQPHLPIVTLRDISIGNKRTHKKSRCRR